MLNQGMGVLVVDDEPTDIVVVQKSLERAGFTVFVGADFDEAMAVFNARANEIELLLTDVSLPGRTGLDLAKACLAEKPTLKILLMSGWVGAEFLDYAGIPKANPHFLPKPFRSLTLINRVRQVLASTDQLPWLYTGDRAVGEGAGG